MATVLITGANRGIGLEFARQYLADNWQVVACCRDPDQADELRALADDEHRLQVERVDVTDHAQIDALAGRFREPIDVLLNNAGIIGPIPIPAHIGKQHFGSLDYDLWERVLRTNTFGPIKMAEAFLPQVEASEQKKIVSLSSSLGSIAERDTPAYAYATSKTALNKAMTLLAASLRDRDVIVTVVCPGYVKTRMDFGTANVEIPDSVAGLRRLIAGFTLADSGTFTRYNGERIPW
ncbi:MAG: SDR family oxidoreductase [Gammaproteobacteria bacterium]|nr:SDR family oxidoreductase [Gammaproteobacteria bacterium]